MTVRTPPHLPRERWASHPRHPEQLLLVGSHRNFRRVSRAVTDGVARGDALAPLERLHRRFIAAMRSHEAYEERKLYPFLARRWSARFDDCEEGHRQLHEADDRVREAFSDARGDEARRGALRDALEHHDEVLRRHLEQEEDRVIPLLLELPPREFDELVTYDLRVLMRRMDERLDR